MPIVINELEVVIEPPPAGQGTPPQASPAPPALTPLQVAELMERRARQDFRLFAH